MFRDQFWISLLLQRGASAAKVQTLQQLRVDWNDGGTIGHQDRADRRRKERFLPSTSEMVMAPGPAM
jgi:hypothetical protein